MNHSFNPDKTELTLTIGKSERHFLKTFKGEFTDKIMVEMFEDLIDATELDWIDPSVTGDLTSAPMLAIWGGERPLLPGETEGKGNLTAFYVWGNPPEKPYIRAVLGRWAFLDYQLRSPLEDLRDAGQCVFKGGMLVKEAA
jgi:hypothetical protein